MSKLLSCVVSILAVNSVVSTLSSNRTRVGIDLVSDRALPPTRGTSGSAGWDIPSPETFDLEPGEVKIVDLGFRVAFRKSFYLSLQTRSSCSIKQRLVLANGTEGVIDSDYQNTIKLALHNAGSETLHISRGDRVAQMLLKKHYQPIWTKHQTFLGWLLFELAHSGDRRGGLGSTGR